MNRQMGGGPYLWRAASEASHGHARAMPVGCNPFADTKIRAVLQEMLEGGGRSHAPERVVELRGIEPLTS